MANRILVATLILGSLIVAAQPAAAQRPYMWWASRVVNAPGVNTCLSIAETAMNGQGLYDVQRDAAGVAGVTEQSYAIITCVEGSNQRMTAVIMVASNDRAESERVRDGLADRIVRIRGW